MADLQQARTAKSHLRTALAGRDGVRGIGLQASGDGYELRVNVERPTDGDGVPDRVDGVPVGVRVVGAIRAS
ncbi:hypothetical protein ICW40_01520 [Actinotalea ferrariae]|uniref:hypothetical protein n=1 Tax=Actinotalea ferrariae TaxID=1386098 RepID=UPI001C8BA1A4|nr:hypothetical protein [Actinotalea ferrariae]MBX9243483.1 hypothetical protein [Actinotalea ferrariae]